MNNTRNVLENEPNRRFNLGISDPPLWTEEARNYNDIVFLKSFTFYPCIYNRKRDCIKEKYLSDTGVFAMHTWTMSWKKKH